MEDLASTAETPVSSPSPAPALLTGAEDSSEDACSICLEPFSAEDPATVTNCKHEYHLQCILDWSQRSKECPICWQLLVLKDPVSQELLAAVEMERSSRSRRRTSNASSFPRIPLEDFEFHDVPSYTDDSDFDERIMQHLAAAAMGRAHHFSRRERHRSSGLAHSQFVVFAAPSNGSDVQQTRSNTLIESQDSANSVSPEGDSPTVVLSPSIAVQSQVFVPSPHASTDSEIAGNGHSTTDRVVASQTPPGSPQRSRSSELLSFSESLKAKLSAASSRYKESISKSTRGFKEKLLARNSSVKEISKEVQREVTAGIAGVARMMERLDPTSKRSSSVSCGTEGTSKSSSSGHDVQGSSIVNSPHESGERTPQGTSSNASIHASGALSSVSELHVGAARVQDSP
ncbi:E3 ubiquitin-protein ligase RHF2A-like [Magnolia sinica]|uniref:E3 ubiquitin-protein ligase RHF2A-like n=1 Tax=Magnolia sinica TaxID=86752 RepID=UPI002659C7C1|nr:E3 ubiquitin-protein ligase RHF2A-like [Magnolia sinica]